MVRNPIEIGDIFEIPLRGGMKAFGQYLYMDVYGPIIGIFNLILEENQYQSLQEKHIQNLSFHQCMWDYLQLLDLKDG